MRCSLRVAVLRCCLLLECVVVCVLMCFLLCVVCGLSLVVRGLLFVVFDFVD